MKKKILILAAHPDDETLGCGATIAKLASDKNNYIKLVTFTDGVSSRESNLKNRNLKLTKVSQILGINNFDIGNFPDNKMDSIPLLEVCKFIEQKVKFNPDIIFTHHPECLNIDHNIVYRATITAFRPQKKNSTEINCYTVSSSIEYNPLKAINYNVYYDVEKYYKKKISALKVYKNELRPYPHPRNTQSIINHLKTTGSEVGLKFSEKFHLVRKTIL
jgi:LmbE family N-acetylglucosaminyl deacetylase